MRNHNNNTADATPLNILMLDDEEYTMADHREALARSGHTVFAVTSLKQAAIRLEQGFRGERNLIDFVLIDLMLEELHVTGFVIGPTGGKDSLDNYYKNLQAQKLNQGQALGQWLWERGGRRWHEKGPMHCYFTNVPDLYQFHKVKEQQEFWLGTKDALVNTNEVRELLLDKTAIAPNTLPTEVSNIIGVWEKRFLVG